jgi:trigger factor
VDEALRERGVEPVDTPDIRDVVVEEGQPLKFTATFETVPPIEPGDYATITLHQKSTTVSDAAVDEALTNLRERAARYEPVAVRGIQHGDSVVMDLVRTAIPKAQVDAPLVVIAGEPTPPTPPAEPQTDKHNDVTVEIGATANPPGFDHALIGLQEGQDKTFDVQYPDDYAIQDLAGTTVTYSVNVKAIRSRVVPELDDEFAKDLGDFENLGALRARVRADLEHEAKHEAERDSRGELLKQLASRVTFDVPAALLDREIDRRMEDFVRRLTEQQIDPMKVNINWEEFREKQRDAASEAVRGALALDEVARRERISVNDGEVNAEVERYAERSGRGAAAVRAKLEKEGGIARLYSGLRREKTVDFLLARATKIQAG